MKLFSILAVLLGLIPTLGGDILGNAQTAGFVGCYQLQLGRWTRLWLIPATPSANQIPPSKFRLESQSVGAADPNRFQLDPKTIVAGRPSGLDGWRLESDGSNRPSVTWTDGFTGVSLQLTPEKNGLRGFATAFTDGPALLAFPMAHAVATRMSCDSKK